MHNQCNESGNRNAPDSFCRLVSQRIRAHSAAEGSHILPAEKVLHPLIAVRPVMGQGESSGSGVYTRKKPRQPRTE